MRAIKLTTSLLFTCFATLNIFSQTNPVLSYVPEDAKMIIKINPGNLAQKMKWEEFVQQKMFEDMIKDVPEKGKEFLKNSGQTGIDLSQGIFLVIPQNKGNKKAGPVIYGIPNDTARFAAMVKKLMPLKQAVKVGNGKLIIDKNTALAWNDEIFILTGKSKTEGGTVKQLEAAELTNTKQLIEKCKTLLRKRPSVLNNEHFKSLLKEEGDLLLWINNTLQSQPQTKNKTTEMFAMVNKNFMRGGNYASGVIKFEDGKVTMQMKRYVSASLDSVYKKYPVKNINTDLLKKLPAGQPIFLCSFSFSPEMINEIFIKAGSDKYIDSLSKKNIKIRDVVSAIRGDATLAAMKVYEFTEEDSVTQAMNGMQLFLAGSIGDKEKFKSLANLLQTKKEDTAKNNWLKKMKPFILSDDSFFVVSLSQIAGQKFLGSSGNEEIEKIIGPYKNYPSAFIIDLRTIFGIAIQAMSKSKSGDKAKQTSDVLSMFDKLISYGGRYDNSSVSSTIELTLANKDENSLKQFIDLLNLFYLMGNKKSTNSQGMPDVEKRQ